jgi:hypothetical protein
MAGTGSTVEEIVVLASLFAIEMSINLLQFSACKFANVSMRRNRAW